MAYRPHGRARVNPTHPENFCICARCGCLYNQSNTEWAMDYRGNQITNLQLRICKPCQDVPQNQLRPIILPPDPVPAWRPQPEPYAQDNAGSISAAEAGQMPVYVPELT